MKEYLWGVSLSKERFAWSQESFKDKGRIRGLSLALQKCWLLENSTTISLFRVRIFIWQRRHHTLFFCLPFWFEWKYWNTSMIDILHPFIQNLAEFGRILKQVQMLGHLPHVCMMFSRLIPPKSPWFEWTCKIPVNVLYFLNFNGLKYTDKTLTRVFACLADLLSFYSVYIDLKTWCYHKSW